MQHYYGHNTIACESVKPPSNCKVQILLLMHPTYFFLLHLVSRSFFSYFVAFPLQKTLRGVKSYVVVRFSAGNFIALPAIRASWDLTIVMLTCKPVALYITNIWDTWCQKQLVNWGCSKTPLHLYIDIKDKGQSSKDKNREDKFYRRNDFSTCARLEVWPMRRLSKLNKDSDHKIHVSKTAGLTDITTFLTHNIYVLCHKEHPCHIRIKQT